MQYLDKFTETYTVPFDFDNWLEFSLQTEETVSKAIHKEYIGHNYMGKYNVSLKSIDSIGPAYITTTGFTATANVTFTVECIQLKSGKPIFNPEIVEKKKDSYFGHIALPEGGSIYVIYDDAYNIVFAGSIFPVIIKEVSHNPYAREVIVIGDVIVPLSKPEFYMHDSSLGPSVPKTTAMTVDGSTKEMFDKIKGYYDFAEVSGSEMTHFKHSNTGTGQEKVYSTRGTFGPIIELESGKPFAGIPWTTIMENVRTVNVYDIEDHLIGLKNAILLLCDLYNRDPSSQKKILPYIRYIKNVSHQLRAPKIGNAEVPIRRRLHKQ